MVIFLPLEVPAVETAEAVPSEDSLLSDWDAPLPGELPQLVIATIVRAASANERILFFINLTFPPFLDSLLPKLLSGHSVLLTNLIYHIIYQLTNQVIFCFILKYCMKKQIILSLFVVYHKSGPVD